MTYAARFDNCSYDPRMAVHKQVRQCRGPASDRHPRRRAKHFAPPLALWLNRSYYPRLFRGGPAAIAARARAALPRTGFADMLDTLRRGANNWLSKFILGLIMLSFVAFGITTRLPGMGGSDDAMEIGGSRLSVQDFDR